MSLVCLANCMFVSTLCTMLWFCWQINDDDDDDDDIKLSCANIAEFIASGGLPATDAIGACENQMSSAYLFRPIYSVY